MTIKFADPTNRNPFFFNIKSEFICYFKILLNLQLFFNAYSTKEATGRSAPQGTSVHNLEISRKIVVHGNNFIPFRTGKILFNQGNSIDSLLDDRLKLLTPWEPFDRFYPTSLVRFIFDACRIFRHEMRRPLLISNFFKIISQMFNQFKFKKES